MWPVTRVSVWVDAVGQAVGANLVREWEDGKKSSQNFGVGPFDSPKEVFERLLQQLDTQLQLW